MVTGVGERCFGASLKRLDPGGDPWRNPKLRLGARLRARLEPPRSWGQFVALEIGEYALLRTPASDPPGSEVVVEIVEIDRTNKKLLAELCAGQTE